MFTVDVIKITGRIYFRLSIQQSCIQKTIEYGSKWIHPGAHPTIFHDWFELAQKQKSTWGPFY